MRKDLTRETTCEEYVINKVYELEEMIEGLRVLNNSAQSDANAKKNCIREIMQTIERNKDKIDDKLVELLREVLLKYRM